MLDALPAVRSAVKQVCLDLTLVSHADLSLAPIVPLYRCDEEFMVMGLRGLTVLIASGDDGIGNLIVRKNPKVGCSRAWPDWPASSAYVTAVGATQLSDTYLPACTAT